MKNDNISKFFRRTFTKFTSSFPYDSLSHFCNHVRSNVDKYNEYGALVKLPTEENGTLGENPISMAHISSTNPTLIGLGSSQGFGYERSMNKRMGHETAQN